MKLRIILLSWLLVFLALFSGVAETSSAQDQICISEWNWDSGVVNLFTGVIDLSSLPAADEATIRVLADYSPREEELEYNNPVFTVVNGKRIAILRQSDTITITQDHDNQVISFEGSLKMPEKGHLQRVVLSVMILDGKGEEIRRITEAVGRGGGSGAQEAGVFYISFNINILLIGFAASALLVWGMVFYRYNRMKKRKQE